MIARVMHCPKCKFQHVDEGEWATRPHRTHLCGNCWHQWDYSGSKSIGVRTELDGKRAELLNFCDEWESFFRPLYMQPPAYAPAQALQALCRCVFEVCTEVPTSEAKMRLLVFSRGYEYYYDAYFAPYAPFTDSRPTQEVLVQSIDTLCGLVREVFHGNR